MHSFEFKELLCIFFLNYKYIFVLLEAYDQYYLI